MAGDIRDQPGRAPEAPSDTAALNAWLDAQLGRTLIVVALRRVDAGEDVLASWRAQAEAFPRMRLEVIEVAASANLTATLTDVARRDPDALLVCDAGDREDAQRWRAAILDAAEGANLFERMLIALHGVGMTRAIARQRGYEDGFATDQPMGTALAVVAREAVTRATYRRAGSSPPCYL